MLYYAIQSKLYVFLNMEQRFPIGIYIDCSIYGDWQASNIPKFDGFIGERFIYFKSYVQSTTHPQLKFLRSFE